jgi:hypothetical protein
MQLQRLQKGLTRYEQSQDITTPLVRVTTLFSWTLLMLLFEENYDGYKMWCSLAAGCDDALE